MVDGVQVAKGVIGATAAAKLLMKGVTFVKLQAKKGNIGYFYVNHKESGQAMLFYKVDVLKMRTKLIKEQEKELKKLRKAIK